MIVLFLVIFGFFMVWFLTIVLPSNAQIKRFKKNISKEEIMSCVLSGEPFEVNSINDIIELNLYENLHMYREPIYDGGSDFFFVNFRMKGGINVYHYDNDILETIHTLRREKIEYNSREEYSIPVGLFDKQTIKNIKRIINSTDSLEN